MAGLIVEIDGRHGLFIVVDLKSYEDLGSMSYSRDYYVVPYTGEYTEKDDIVIDMNKSTCIKVRGAKDPVKVRKDKKSFRQYGYSNIRGDVKLYLERKWDDVKVPTR